MKPETSKFLEKARQCLASGRANLSIHESNDAGRNAYLTAYHAAQAYIYSKSDTVAKTHKGVHSLFTQLAKDDQRIPRELQRFISQAYDLKAVADYEFGSDSIIPIERSEAAIETAAKLLNCIASIVEKNV
jgi:uncharacterized protein (UPF0332 family)